MSNKAYLIKFSNNMKKISDVIHMESNTIYYGVHVPNDIQAQDTDGSRYVFIDKAEALKEVKKFKKARFKAFQFYHEAIEFVLHGSEFPNNNSAIDLNSKNEVTHSIGEKPSQFRGPKSQDLVKLRKAIESGDLHFVKTTVWENPRYLISSGDTPAILQEGSRYNALHVAAKDKNAEMCDFILRTVGSPEFIQLLYGEENRSNAEEGSKILLDLYLNTPDKGHNETPLHFAVKFGAADAVEVLVSYPECDKTVLNKYSEMPKDIICKRVTNPSKVLIDRIADLLDDRFYVPVLRSEDNCIQPVIGQPFSPTSPPQLNKNPIDPRMEIHAYAGPMKKDEATVFRKKWKTPPRIICTPPRKFAPQSSLISSRKDDLEDCFRLQDTEKGLERVGRELAKKHNVGWKEYWPFLDTFVDLASKDGLEKLESYLKARYVNSFSENMTNTINSRKNDSNFSPVNNSTVESPISELCKNFEACTLNDKSVEIRPAKITANAQNIKQSELILDNIPKSGLSPRICIDKMCQVYANRLANIIYQLDEVTVHTLDYLEIEIKHLKSSIASFMEDACFSFINFQSVHARIAYLISCILKDSLIFNDEIDAKILNLEKVIEKYDKMVDLFSSDDEELNCYRSSIQFVRRKSTSHSKQVICVIQNTLKYLECISDIEFMDVITEEDCIRAWNVVSPCACVWKTNKSSRRGLLPKKSSNKLFGKATNAKVNPNKVLEGVSRKLNFLEEDYSGKNENIEFAENNQTGRDANDSDVRYSSDTISSSSDEEFKTANNTPALSEDENDSFEDAEVTDLNVFIEGDSPSKVDYCVYTAIKHIKVSPEEYPYIYRWQHSVKLFSEEVRASWPTPTCSRCNTNIYNAATSTPRPEGKGPTLTPPQPWLRITGQNSPMRSLQALKGCAYLPHERNCYYNL